MEVCGDRGTVELSLEQAIRHKYCPLVDDSAIDPLNHRTIQQTALRYKPGGCPVYRRSSIVLDHSGVRAVEGGPELGELCESVEEMILSANEITQWSHVCNILSTVPKLSFLDLSHNELDSSSVAEAIAESEEELAFSQLKTLVLNCTHLQWTAIQQCLNMLPNLEELHLSINDYTTVDFDPSFSHPSISRLHFNHNTISKWEEITKLSTAFPGLQKLVASSLPVAEIPQQNTDLFPSLSSLYLNDSSLSNWVSVEHLASLSKLTDLSILNLPLTTRLKEKERRFAVIGRLPELQSLNKSSITETEREDAERWLIRQFMDDPTPPTIYHTLVAKHGIVNRLADVDLRPQTTALFEITFQDKCEQHHVNIKQTLKKFKQWLSENIVGLPPSTFRVFYLDVGSECGEIEMKYEQRELYRYRVKDGDKIHIQLKALRRRQ